MTSRRVTLRRTGRVWLPVLAGTALGLAGYFGSWVAHRSAGLMVTGLDLGEYVKFIPQVIAGQIFIRREVFYWPLCAGSIIASLLASRRALPGWLRILLALGAIPLALALLPPAWSPALLALPEFRLQSGALLFCLMMIPAIAVTRFLPDRVILGLIGLLAIPAAVLPAWSFLQVKPAIEALYRHPIRPGWGFWAGAIGFLFVSFWAIAQMLIPPAQRRD